MLGADVAQVPPELELELELEPPLDELLLLLLLVEPPELELLLLDEPPLELLELLLLVPASLFVLPLLVPESESDGKRVEDSSGSVAAEDCSGESVTTSLLLPFAHAASTPSEPTNATSPRTSGRASRA